MQIHHPISIGKFGRTFGVKGWLYVISFTSNKEDILSYQPWWLPIKGQPDAWEPISITDHQYEPSKGTLKVKLDSYSFPEAAQLVVNKEIYTSKSNLPSLKKDQYYWSDLEGLFVKNLQNLDLGKIDHLFETGSNDVIMLKDGKKERMIPFLETTVIKIDLNEKIMIVDWDAEF